MFESKATSIFTSLFFDLKFDLKTIAFRLNTEEEKKKSVLNKKFTIPNERKRKGEAI